MSAIWFDMVIVPAGEFLMGENLEDKFANDTERPRHLVSISKAFGLGRFPVTVAEYRTFAPGKNVTGDDDWPVAGVSWEDAKAYCRWRSTRDGSAFRLPTEAEWEYACRAGTVTPFSVGTTLDVTQANFLYSEQGLKCGLGRRTRCGDYPPNEFGLHDMHGNVCEWVEDAWRPSYDAGKPEDEMVKVVRGGAWDYLPRLLRSSWRDGLGAAVRRDNVGFRLACDL